MQYGPEKILTLLTLAGPNNNRKSTTIDEKEFNLRIQKSWARNGLRADSNLNISKKNNFG